jgi:predicted GNAT family acetyltransferase
VVLGSTRAGPVYTPPGERGHGYAGALTAWVTRQILDRGSAACLYTDLANPTSNKIYAAIGYEPVADFFRYAFSRARSSRPA